MTIVYGSTVKVSIVSVIMMDDRNNCIFNSFSIEHQANFWLLLQIILLAYFVMVLVPQLFITRLGLIKVTLKLACLGLFLHTKKRDLVMM